MARANNDSVGPLGFRIWAMTGVVAMPRAHTHPDVEINCLESGQINYLFGGVNTSVRAGSVAVFWGGVPHQVDRSSTQVRGTWLTLPIADFLRWSLPGGLPERLMGGGFAQMEWDAKLAARWTADFDVGSSERRRVLLLEVEALVHRVGLHTADGKRATVANGDKRVFGDNTSHVSRVTAFLASHYAEPITLPLIASAVKLNPKYLAQIFKSKTRLTVHGYLTRMRVAHAQRLLATTELRVIDVAQQSGFGSLASFYASFERVAGGVPPHRYRRKLRQSTDC